MRCGVILWTALLASSCPQWTRAFSLAGGGRLSNERQTFRALGATISNNNNDSDVYIPDMADEAVAFARKWGIPSTARSTTTHDNHQYGEYIPSMADEAEALARKWGVVVGGNDDHDETNRRKDQRVIPPSPIEANGNILVKEIAEVDTIVANRQEDRPPFAVASRANHMDDTSVKEQAEQGPHVLAIADTSMASMAFPDDDGDDHDDDDDADNDDNASVEENEFEPPRVLTVADMIAAAAARDADSNNSSNNSSSNPQDVVDVEETNQQLRTMYKEFLDQRNAYGAAATTDKPLFRVPPVKRAVRKQKQSTSILNNPTPVKIMAQGKKRRFEDAVIPDDDRIRSQPAPVFSRSDHTTSNCIVPMADQATAFARKWGIVEQ